MDSEKTLARLNRVKKKLLTLELLNEIAAAQGLERDGNGWKRKKA